MYNQILSNNVSGVPFEKLMIYRNITKSNNNNNNMYTHLRFSVLIIVNSINCDHIAL